MSRFDRTEIACGCGRRLTVRVVHDLHASARPEDRAQILAGTYQEHRCDGCGRVIVVESPFVYTDFSREHYVAVEPPDRPIGADTVAMHARVFRRCFDDGPPIARELGAGLRRRVVYGLVGLREKLRLWDAGFDDYVVEALKLDLLERLAAAGIGASVAVVVELPPGGELVITAFRSRPDAPVPDDPRGLATIVIPRERYLARLADRAEIARGRPDLADDWLVDATSRVILPTRISRGP